VKVVLDTNVLVSGLLKPRSKPAKILRLILQGDMDIIISEHILSEYYEVLKREKFSFEREHRACQTLMICLSLKQLCQCRLTP